MVSELNSSQPEAAFLERLRQLPAHLRSRIRGQDHVLERIASTLIRGELALANPRRPRGSFLMVGPTGVGKTETTNAFTEYVFGGTKPIRFDMSEYQLQKSVDRLLGEDASDSGLLGRSLQGVAAGTLLFDEIDKAHPLVLDLFLQVLEDARITLATGETLDVRNFYVVCTSNIGSEEAMRMESAPFASVERTVQMRVRERLRPELVGRISEILVFSRLTYDVQRTICEDLIRAEIHRLAQLGYVAEKTPSAVEFLVRTGYHRMLGARPMRMAVERYVQEALIQDLLSGGTGCGKLLPDTSETRLILTQS